MIDGDLERWGAAYVLGALSPQDRLAYERFVLTDGLRTAGVLEFAQFPSILNKLSSDEANLLASPDGDILASGRPSGAPPRTRRWLPLLS